MERLNFSLIIQFVNENQESLNIIVKYYKTSIFQGWETDYFHGTLPFINGALHLHISMYF